MWNKAVAEVALANARSELGKEQVSRQVAERVRDEARAETARVQLDADAALAQAEATREELRRS